MMFHLMDIICVPFFLTYMITSTKVNEIKKNAVLLVWKCFDRQLCESFQNFVTVREHEQNTRTTGLCLKS